MISLRPRLLRAAAAGALALVLLSGTSASYALWSDTVAAGSGQIASGALRLEQQPMTITLERPAADGTVTSQDVTTTLSARRLAAGDTVVYRVPVRVVARGDLLTATLALDTTGLVGPGSSTELAAAVRTSTSVALTGAGTPVTGTAASRRITPADDGGTVLATVRLTIPAAPAAGQDWAGRLQQQTLAPGAVRWSLTQN
ncbi:hypothetical protein [Georgenia wangjunii]|uniref:hypothetical protein n=1 Tax=Georgenia wangjunii TaxID=3117730 RepID=UPI002F2644F9